MVILIGRLNMTVLVGRFLINSLTLDVRFL